MLQFVAVKEEYFLGLCMCIVKLIKRKLWSLFPRHPKGFTCRIWDGFLPRKITVCSHFQRTYLL